MVAIKDMEMPNNCYDCYRNMYCIVGIDGGWRPDRRVEDCPLVEIGTCKDCAKSKILNDFEGYSIVCSRFGRMAVNPNFYCADFEKRGNENE